MNIGINQIRIVLDEVRKEQGIEAVAAILKHVAAIDADSIDPADYPEIMRLCDHAELAGGTVTCRHDDEAPRRRTTRRAARRHEKKAEGRTLSAFETVVNAAPTLQDGLSMAAKVIHSRNKNAAG